VAAVIPTTNPTSTAIFKCLICLKTRNAIMISPHPRAKKCTIEAARIVRDAAEQAGCPKDIISWIEQPSLELTNDAHALGRHHPGNRWSRHGQRGLLLGQARPGRRPRQHPGHHRRHG
jgi:acyl-CoA reductase-like NAD-dependent aldehyde dehydrogenase